MGLSVSCGREFEILIERGEDGYFIGSAVGLPGCHSQAKTLDELMKNMKEAIELYLEVETDIQPIKFVGIQKLSLDGDSSNCLVA
jgi:predicted RNase H-like HicB family nuclease